MTLRHVGWVAICAVAIMPGFFAPYDPATQFRDHILSAPSARFVLGTDALGRDQLSRLLYGTQISLLTGVLAAILTLTTATILGVTAGYYGGWIDRIISLAAEMFQVLPWLYLLIAVRASLPLHIGAVRSFVLTIAIIGVVGWARPARLIRGVALSAKERDYVAAARGFGATDGYLLRRHVLPQCRDLILTQAFILVPHYILAEVSLGFVGLGVPEPVPTLGNLLAPLREYRLATVCWWLYLPGVVLVMLLLFCQRRRVP